MRRTSKLLGTSLLLASSLFMSGCAPLISGAMNMGLSEADVIAKTAQYFGTTEQAITVTNIQKNALDTTYQTRHSGKFYNCYIYYGGVQCKQPGA